MRIIFARMRIIIKQYKNTKKCVYLTKSALYRDLASPYTIFQQVPYRFVISLYRNPASPFTVF